MMHKIIYIYISVFIYYCAKITVTHMNVYGHIHTDTYV